LRICSSHNTKIFNIFISNAKKYLYIINE